MNLYAIQPDHAACSPTFFLFENDERAAEMAIFVAADDMAGGEGSPSASVYVVARDLSCIAQGHAEDLLTHPLGWTRAPERRAELAKRLQEWKLFGAEMIAEAEKAQAAE